MARDEREDEPAADGPSDQGRSDQGRSDQGRSDQGRSDRGPSDQGPSDPQDVSAGADTPPDAEADETAGDRDVADLEAGGIDAVLSRMRADGGVDDFEPMPRRRRGRSPLLSLVVIAFGAYLLVSMWDDFRYWTKPRHPVDLGHVARLVHEGEVPAGFDNQFVKLSGTPDVQHAARLTTKQKFVGYLRIVEAGGSLFAAIPRSKDEEITNTFEGTYVGRMRRLADTAAFPWVQQFFEQEKISKVSDFTPDALRAALTDGSLTRLVTSLGEVEIGPEDFVRIVVAQPEATVQLGIRSFRDVASAEQAVAALGFPWIRLDRPATAFHSFLVRIPAGELDAVQQRLAATIDVPADNADPRVGVVVLPRTATYSSPAAAVVLDGDRLRFPLDDDTTGLGYEVRDGRLVETKPADGMIAVPLSAVTAMRLEQPVHVDPDGYVVLVGTTPDELWANALLWLVVLGITGVNVLSVTLWWRRRATAAVA